MESEYKEFLEALGRRVKELRKEKGWSLRDMVVIHGYHDSQWRKYESGGGLTIPSLLRIARQFDTPLSTLLDGLVEFPKKSVAEIQGKNGMAATAKAKKRARPKA